MQKDLLLAIAVGLWLHVNWNRQFLLALFKGNQQAAVEIPTIVQLIRRKTKMLKIRLKRLGAKKNPTYRVIVINSTTKREGRPIEELGHYNPKTKEMKLNLASAQEWVKKGAQPTETVAYLMKNCNEDGTLNYKKSTVEKLSKKALAKKAEEEAAAKAAAAESSEEKAE